MGKNISGPSITNMEMSLLTFLLPIIRSLTVYLDMMVYLPYYSWLSMLRWMEQREINYLFLFEAPNLGSMA